MSKKKLPWSWFPCYADRWLKDTRELTDTQARVYWDFLCVSYLRDEGIVTEADKWVAHELRCSIQKWRTVKTFLLGCGLLVETPCKGIANPKVLEVCRERQQRSKVRAESAETRHRNPELPFVINRRGDANADTRARASFTSVTSIEESRKEDSPPTSPRRTLPSDVVSELLDREGTERTESLIEDYQRSGMADGAKNLRNAFIGWLKNQHSIDLSHMKTQKGSAGKLSAAEILRQCAMDPDINPALKKASGR